MKHPFWSLPGLLTAAWCGTLLGGCVNLEPQIDETRFYTLASALPARTGTQPAGAVSAALRVSVAADYLQQPAIAVRETAQEIALQEGHRWAEQIKLGVARIVQDGLERRNESLAIEQLARHPGGDHQLLIDIMVTACEGTRDGGAVLDADWQIFTGNNAAPRTAGRFHGTEPGWDGQDFGQLAALLSQLADELAGDIAPTIEQAAAQL